jgi:hypothetical protein
MHLQPSKPSFVSVDFARPRLTSNGLGAAESLSGRILTSFRSWKRSIACAFSFVEPLHTPPEDLGLLRLCPTTTMVEPLTRRVLSKHPHSPHQGLPSGSWLSSEIINSLPRQSACDRLQFPRKEDHPLRHLAVHTPQLRPPESNIEVDVSTNKCVAARAKHGLLRFKQGQGACSMHDQATRSAFQISFGCQLIVARPSPPSWAAGQNEASPPHWLHQPSAYA